MLSNIKGVIFDLDGTIVDSMWVWSQIDIDYLKKKGHAVPNDLKNDIEHLSFYQTAVYFKNRFKIEDSVDEILSDWHHAAFHHYANNVKLKSGVKTFLRYLKDNKIKIALATSNSISLLEACLKNNGVYDYFDSITITDEVAKGKDCPDIYLLAAKKLNIKPEYCLVFEDILPAMKSAKKANMRVIGIKDDLCLEPISEILKYCDKYIFSFTELL
ncbi:HAD family hydrolase [Clostridium beijerinckii]|uniref:HAD family phosphatase n=1 Tax=Clostridium beijerinckii TaxID=1520 RepID=A0AAW3W7P0_CLOBE|nr:HAD family phosphatase [Clostridium beijerinckii]MBC2457588.1 HAD family phosphatase [Clostridium beijerinckii]MBC2474587.1 HAD family phosphatase [Clostridium beijerinckii]NOV62456.1 HAD superfamily hydrolase (TIGR01509 family) [Clostridium beijerinckii]NOV68047.1 HAD superfamily hydrolase (TIGR01509 family) [Clostridium beijerinckii]NOW30508.1 HAD superfamily hydrolase (TIGR01509 family) [Clostridium beijerinckii]